MPESFKLFNILNDTGIEYKIRKYCGRNLGTDDNSKLTLLQLQIKKLMNKTSRNNLIDRQRLENLLTVGHSS